MGYGRESVIRTDKSIRVQSCHFMSKKEHSEIRRGQEENPRGDLIPASFPVRIEGKATTSVS